MMCVGEPLTSTEDPIWVEATGQAPFTVSVRVRQKDHQEFIVLENVESSRFALDLPGVLEMSGKYHVELVRVQDANGCFANMGGLPNTEMVIDALGIATITPLDACGEVCVGDQLEYSLSGDGPFTIGKSALSVFYPVLIPPIFL
jgi:nucleoporin POM152